MTHGQVDQLVEEDAHVQQQVEVDISLVLPAVHPRQLAGLTR